MYISVELNTHKQMPENKEKRKLKKEPKLNLSLDEQQKQVRALFYQYDVNFVHGDAGSGKGLVACYIALSSFRKKEYNKIIIARPIVKHNIGYLKGDLDQKMKPFVAPIVHNFNMLQSPNQTEKMMSDLDIEILPVDFAKGITYVDSVVIIDEYQDMNYEDFRTMLTRLGKNSKIIFCGSEEQIHRSIRESCIAETKKLISSDLVGYTKLTGSHRNPAIKKITDFLEK